MHLMKSLKIMIDLKQDTFDFYLKEPKCVKFFFETVPCSCGEVHLYDKETWLIDTCEMNGKRSHIMKCSNCGEKLMLQKTFV